MAFAQGHSRCSVNSGWPQRDWPEGMTLEHLPRQSALRLPKDDPLCPSPGCTAAKRRPRRSGRRGPRTAACAPAPGGVRREAGPARPLPAVGSFRHEPGPGDADEAPERGEDDDREGEGVSRHGGARDAQIRALGQLQMLPARAGPGRSVGSQACAPGPGRPRERTRRSNLRRRARASFGERDGLRAGFRGSQIYLALISFPFPSSKIIYRAEACVEIYFIQSRTLRINRAFINLICTYLQERTFLGRHPLSPSPPKSLADRHLGEGTG